VIGVRLRHSLWLPNWRLNVSGHLGSLHKNLAANPPITRTPCPSCDPQKLRRAGIHPCNNVTKPYRILLISKADGVFGSHKASNEKRQGLSKKYNSLWLRSFRIFERDRRGSVSHAPVYAAAGLGLLLAGTMKPLLKRFCMIVVLVFGCVAPRLMP
jgi:hypothetical protein